MRLSDKGVAMRPFTLSLFKMRAHALVLLDFESSLPRQIVSSGCCYARISSSALRVRAAISSISSSGISDHQGKLIMLS